MKLHELKLQQPFFDDVYYNRKDFEVRKNDRCFKIGDRLKLVEYPSENPKYVLKDIKYILEGGQHGIGDNYVVLGLKDVSFSEPPLFGRCCYKLPVLVGFEESQVVTKQLREKRIEAYSCDIQECSGGHPEWHLKMDIFQALRLKKWGGVILHPPCTFTALCGNRWYWNSEKRIEGIELCKKAWEEACKVCDYVALEQPKTIMQKYIGQRTQTIHPWQFGHGETKETWLWLKGFPKLIPTEIVEGRENRIWKMPPSRDRGKLRSKTYHGIAKAISEQWF